MGFMLVHSQALFRIVSQSLVIKEKCIAIKALSAYILLAFIAVAVCGKLLYLPHQLEWQMTGKG